MVLLIITDVNSATGRSIRRQGKFFDAREKGGKIGASMTPLVCIFLIVHVLVFSLSAEKLHFNRVGIFIT